MEEFQIEGGALRVEVESLAELFASMIRPLTDTRVQVVKSDWTIGEHAAHAVSAQRAFKTMVEGGRFDYRGNAHELACFPERDGPTLADLLVDWTSDLLKAAAENEGIRRVHPGFSSQTMTQWTSYSLCHLLMHADPVARTLGLPSPVRTCHLGLALPFLQVAMRGLYDRSKAPDVGGSLAVETADGPSLTLSFVDGEVEVETSVPTSADCYLKTSAGTFLSVTLGLEPESAAIERGDWVISGPYPELGRAFKRLLPNP